MYICRCRRVSGRSAFLPLVLLHWLPGPLFFGCLRLGPSMPLSSLSCIVFIVATSLAVHYYCSNRFVPTQTLKESSRYRNLGETDALALRATSYNHAMSDNASKHALRIE